MVDVLAENDGLLVGVSGAVEVFLYLGGYEFGSFVQNEVSVKVRAKVFFVRDFVPFAVFLPLRRPKAHQVFVETQAYYLVRG